MKPIIDRDEKGNTTHSRWGDGTERWFDSAGNLTHSRWGNGTERWYDAAGRVTHTRFVDGTERWFDYDADGNTTPIAGATAPTGIRKATTKRRTNDTVR